MAITRSNRSPSATDSWPVPHPTSHAVPLVNVMRDDENRPCLGQDAALANAPERSGAFFRVPKILEEGPGEPS